MRSVCALVVFVACLVVAPVTAQKDLSAADVLRAVTENFGAYASKISGVTLREEYTLLDVSGGRIINTRRISSDLVLLDANGRLVALRDPFAVDDNPLREHTPRITNILAKPSQAAWDQAQAYAGESVRYFQDEIIVRLNDPTLVLRFVAPENHMRSSFKIDGKKKIEGIETVGLAFQEVKVKPPAAPNYLLPTPGNAWGRGKLWVEPATGRILRTELSMESDAEMVHITVEYKRDQALDVFLPSSMTDRYEVTERTGGAIGSPGIGRRSFDCRASYSKASFTPIQLNVGK